MKAFVILASLVLSQFASAATSTWEVDSGHASVVFKVNHLGFSNVYGFLPGLEGKITLDEAKPEKSSFDLKIPAVEKISTFNDKRDVHLRGPDFFNTKQFGAMTLKSKSVKKSGNTFDITADLTMHGVTKPVSFKFTQNKTDKDPWGNIRTGGDTSFKVKRTDFGMTYMSKPGEVGDEVEMMVSLEAVKK